MPGQRRVKALHLGDWSVAIKLDDSVTPVWRERDADAPIPYDNGPPLPDRMTRGYVESSPEQKIAFVITGPRQVDILYSVSSDGADLGAIRSEKYTRSKNFVVNGAKDNDGTWRSFVVKPTVSDDTLEHNHRAGELDVEIWVGRLGDEVMNQNNQGLPGGTLTTAAVAKKTYAKQAYTLQLGEELPNSQFNAVSPRAFELHESYLFRFHHNTRELLVASSNGSVPSIHEEELGRVMVQRDAALRELAQLRAELRQPSAHEYNLRKRSPS
ncbi:hypothetical protein CALCODRAFT_205139 [Calocera cornea HHB12733]|uniref:Uncharacterized protein n=1 Tax=Calocera cornea HHB12733 TaxID=1353952 RepID=A0A165K0J9_9BASI|nr:hypothetical protein CALCODRAFT_205139 [Calocera cornea HHB12733]